MTRDHDPDREETLSDSFTLSNNLARGFGATH